MATLKLGRECTLTIGTNELKLAKEVTVEISGNEADVTSRDSAGIKRVMIAMKEITISGSALYSTDDSAVTSLINAADTNTPLAVTISDPSFTFTGHFAVTSLTHNQPLDDVSTIDFTLKPTISPPA